MEQHFGSCLGCIVDTGMFQAVGKSYPGWMLDMMLIPSRKNESIYPTKWETAGKSTWTQTCVISSAEVELQEQSKVATDGGRVWRSSKINRKVVQPENSGKIMGTSNIKACDIRHLPFPRGVVVGWKPQVTASITNKPLGSVCQLDFHASKFWAKKLVCVFFCSMLTTSSPIVQYRVIYGYRICLLQYTHVSFPPKTTQSWWSCGLTKRKPLCLKRLYFVKTENVSAVRKGKRALYYDMDLHCCWLGKSLGSLC